MLRIHKWLHATHKNQREMSQDVGTGKSVQKSLGESTACGRVWVCVCEALGLIEKTGVPTRLWERNTGDQSGLVQSRALRERALWSLGGH